MELNEPIVAYGKSRFTVEEYLQMERAATERHEYYRGEIFRMQGHGEALAMSGAETGTILFSLTCLANCVLSLKEKNAALLARICG